MTPQVEVIVRNLTLVGEGPHYSSRNGGIFYYVDIPGNKVGRYDIKGGKNTFIKVEVSMLLMMIIASRVVIQSLFSVTKVPGEGPFVTFIIPIEGSTREFIIGHTHNIAYAEVDWDGEKVCSSTDMYECCGKVNVM